MSIFTQPFTSHNMKEAVIPAEKVGKVYNPDKIPVVALSELSLSIEAGEFTAIVGPSGSGKTTLLNIIGGLDRPSSGTVWVGGHNITELTDAELIDFRREHIGFVFQAYNLIPVLTARENTEFVMLLQGRPKAEREARTRELLAAVGLTDQMDKRPAEMSGGQQQRVAVARALANRPSLVLADEPTANVDPSNQQNILDLIRESCQEGGVSLLMVTHSLEAAGQFDRVNKLTDFNHPRGQG